MVVVVHDERLRSVRLWRGRKGQTLWCEASRSWPPLASEPSEPDTVEDDEPGGKRRHGDDRAIARPSLRFDRGRHDEETTLGLGAADHGEGGGSHLACACWKGAGRCRCGHCGVNGHLMNEVVDPRPFVDEVSNRPDGRWWCSGRGVDNLPDRRPDRNDPIGDHRDQRHLVVGRRGSEVVIEEALDDVISGTGRRHEPVADRLQRLDFVFECSVDPLVLAFVEHNAKSGTSSDNGQDEHGVGHDEEDSGAAPAAKDGVTY
ncbi:MAG: hypothetical protein ACFCVK_05790 [Acidimicrobiales bacterium]